MANKSDHYRKAVDKIHHREIKDYQPEVVREYYPEFNLTIVDGATCFESKIKFSVVETEQLIDNQQKEERIFDLFNTKEELTKEQGLKIVKESYFERIKHFDALETLNSFYSSLLKPQMVM